MFRKLFNKIFNPMNDESQAAPSADQEVPANPAPADGQAEPAKDPEQAAPEAPAAPAEPVAPAEEEDPAKVAAKADVDAAEVKEHAEADKEILPVKVRALRPWEDFVEGDEFELLPVVAEPLIANGTLEIAE